jgi:hypothetical protein
MLILPTIKRLTLFIIFASLVISPIINSNHLISIPTHAQSCPDGQVSAGGSCIPCPAESQGCGQTQTCPSYQVLINGTCQACPTNQNPVNGVCVPIVCPANQTAVNGACVQNCDSGFSRDASGSCVCQPGQNTSKGLCGPSSSTCSPTGGERSDICHLVYCNNGTNNYPACTNCPSVRAPASISNNACPVASASQPTPTSSNNQTTEVKSISETTKKDSSEKPVDDTNKDVVDANKSTESTNDQKNVENTSKTDQNLVNNKDSSTDNSTTIQSESSKTTDQPKKSSNPYIIPIGASVIVLITGVSGFFGYKYWKKSKVK